MGCRREEERKEGKNGWFLNSCFLNEGEILHRSRTIPLGKYLAPIYFSRKISLPIIRHLAETFEHFTLCSLGFVPKCASGFSQQLKARAVDYFYSPLSSLVLDNTLLHSNIRLYIKIEHGYHPRKRLGLL